MAKNTYWVEFEYRYEYREYGDTWVMLSGRSGWYFNCLKKEMTEKVKKCVKDELLPNSNVRNISVKIVKSYRQGIFG